MYRKRERERVISIGKNKEYKKEKIFYMDSDNVRVRDAEDGIERESIALKKWMYGRQQS